MLQRAETDIRADLKTIYEDELVALIKLIGNSLASKYMKSWRTIEPNMRRHRKKNTPKLPNTTDEIILTNEYTSILIILINF